MRLNRRLSFKTFVISQVIILIFGFISIAGLYYFLYLQDAPKPIPKGPVTELPKSLILSLDQPGDNQLSYDSSIVISGKTLPQISVLIFTETQDQMIKSSGSGDFSTVIKLDEGVNLITVASVYSTGESKSDSRTVFYSKEKL